MKFPARLYQTKRGVFLAFYNFHPDIHVNPPHSVRGKSERVAHIAYSEGGRKKGIDIFKYNGDITTHAVRKDGKVSYRSDRHPEISFAKPIEHADGRTLTNVDATYDLSYDMVSLPANVEPELLNFIRADVQDYCKLPAKNPQGARIRHHREIVPVTTIRRIRQHRLLEPGKQEFVPTCGLDANLDFSQGCISGWVPGRNGIQATFDGTKFTNFFLDPSEECSYCYAMPNHESFPKFTYEQIDSARLEAELRGDAKLKFGSDERYGKLVEVLRFGKRTEPGSIYTLENLLIALETCARTGTRTVMPTKFLAFNPEVARLLQRTNSQVLYSYSGHDELEQGAVEHGCTNEWRLEQAVKYGESGVSTSVYLLVSSATSSPSESDLRLIDFARAHQNVLRGVQILPARYTSRALCRQMTGIGWDFLKQQSKTLPRTNGKVKIFHPRQQKSFVQIQNEESRGTCYAESGVLIPRNIHQDWLTLIEDNNGFFRMCHHNPQTTWCGNCFLDNGIITKTVHPEKTKIPKANKKRGKLPLFPEEKTK